MSEYETISVEINHRGVARITLNRPQAHNAINGQMIAELSRAALELGENEQVRIVILAGLGKSFCAGGDLVWMQEQANKDRAGKMRQSKALAEMLVLLDQLPKPLIGRVQGAAFGGGVGMMAVCDIVVASNQARFALSETRLGLIPATIAPFVIRKIGAGFARALFITARGFDAEFARHIALATHICPQQELDQLVEKEVAAALACAPGAMAAAKSLCRQLAGVDPSSFADQTASALADRWESAEAQAGIKAFFDRTRAPWVVD
ncbi:Methylglutaconyl-CoA hydratase [hydrothermal vent metagenome]|uniref:Methylglutaconyl-CoA hydratase n=1 Tax=hydrothermal vent metagenome TaxID=652676 RepID=A0A3B0U3M0_9ZZZZ